MEYENRKNTEIIIPIVIILLLIIALFCLGFYAYNLKVELQEAKTAQIGNENNLNSLEDEYSGTIDLNQEEVGTEINKDDNIVVDLIEKIDFPAYAIASIYKQGTFNLRTISNDLILRLGWAKADKELIENNIDDIGKYKQTVTKEKFENSIINIFGERISYTDDSFTNIDVPTFHAYNENRGVINYSNNTYVANYAKGSGTAPFIYQEIQKVLKYSNKIEIYVKTAFIDVEYDKDIKDYNYIIYKDFKNDKFERVVAETTSTEFTNSYSSNEKEGSSFKSNSEILKVVDKLDTYVYTFTMDGNDGNYYLSGFDSAK